MRIQKQHEFKHYTNVVPNVYKQTLSLVHNTRKSLMRQRAAFKSRESRARGIPHRAARYMYCRENLTQQILGYQRFLVIQKWLSRMTKRMVLLWLQLCCHYQRTSKDSVTSWGQLRVNKR